MIDGGRMVVGWLLDFEWPPHGAALPPAATGLDPGALWRSTDGRLGRAYRLAPSAAAPPSPEWIAVDCLQTIEGRGVRRSAPHHYTVETDVAPEHEDDFNAWYEQEHLPGLARVPGTVRAWRLRRHTGTPRYLACYDLLTPQTLEHPAWLAVRHTAWSSRVRPCFIAPRRTLFVRPAALPH